MKIKIICIGNKAPEWVKVGYLEYAKRMPPQLSLQLLEIAPGKHHRDAKKFKIEEGEKILAQIDGADWVVALDERGQSLSSQRLAKKMENWQGNGGNVAIVIGGSDGLAESVLTRANETLSLSALTLPHYLVRIVLAETLYRAWSINIGHPYHRE